MELVSQLVAQLALISGAFGFSLIKMVTRLLGEEGLNDLFVGPCWAQVTFLIETFANQMFMATS